MSNTSPTGALEYPLDTDWLLRKKRSLRRELLSRDIQWLDKKIAILGGSTTNDIQDMLELFLLKEGIRPTFYASEYNRYWEDAMFDNPDLKEFAPDVIFIHTTSRNITQWPSVTMTTQEIDALLETQFQHFSVMWDKLSAVYGCPVIQNNFDRPVFRLLGNQDIADPRGHSNFVFRLNGKLYEYAGSHADFYIHDIDYLAAQYGQDQWQDIQYWSLYKYALTLKAVPEFARSLANVIKSIYGKNKKAVVLDLDNTLWGGVVGDDGADHLVVGTEIPAGETFTQFQEYLAQLKSLGVLLAVNSKNDEENALAGLNHPNNTLRPDDFTCIMANWRSKDENMRVIAQTLNLGLDSFVFVDDNPAERELVKGQLPVVSLIEGDRPEIFCRTLDHSGFFEVTKLTSDDLVRGEMYKANAQRVKLQESFADYQDYLSSLNMKAVIRDFEPVHLQRIAQLTNKTNQFNLTTRRLSDGEMQQIADDSSYIRLYGRLEDKFGDNGIVSVVIGQIEGEQLHLILWLMSCRVLKRDMELAMFDRLVEMCKQRGIQEIIGYYYPTAKNGMVKDFYNTLGFEKTGEDAEGNTTWRYYPAGHERKNNIIEILD